MQRRASECGYKDCLSTQCGSEVVWIITFSSDLNSLMEKFNVFNSVLVIAGRDDRSDEEIE